MPDAAWKELTEAHFTLFFSEAASLPRGNALLSTLNSLLDDGKSREHSLLTVAWRPLWQQLQGTFSSHQHETARSASGLANSRLQGLSGLVRRSSRFFAPGAGAEVAAAVAPSLQHSSTVAMFSAVAALHLFLPEAVSVADFPPGTAEAWMRAWSLVDHCADWDALWARIFKS